MYWILWVSGKIRSFGHRQFKELCRMPRKVPPKDILGHLSTSAFPHWLKITPGNVNSPALPVCAWAKWPSMLWRWALKQKSTWRIQHVLRLECLQRAWSCPLPQCWNRLRRGSRADHRNHLLQSPVGNLFCCHRYKAETGPPVLRIFFWTKWVFKDGHVIQTCQS